MRSRSDIPPLSGADAAEPEAVGRRLGSNRGRMTIAVLLDYLSVYGGYEGELRDALHAKCRELDLNLLLLYGRAVEEPHPWSAAYNAIFDLVHPDHVDGLVVISTCLASHCGAEGIIRFVHRYQSMAVCSLGVVVPDVPSLVVDSRPGMEAVVEHMVRAHGCRRVAFIAGPARNPEAELRLQVYRDVLDRHGLAWDPALVAEGYFMSGSGYTAMVEILGRGVKFDAVVAANDNMALGAISALRKHGYCVPGDLPVAGFDDVVFARLGNPPLTTAAQPFGAMAETAIRLVLDRLAGRPVPACTQLCAEFVARRSCGCGLLYHEPTAETPPVPVPGAAEYMRERADDLAHGLANCLHGGDTDGEQDAARLSAALLCELEGEPGAFLRAVEVALEKVGDDPERYGAFQNAVTWLRGELRSFNTKRLEDLWHASRELIARAGTSGQVRQRLEIDETYARLLGVGEQLSVAFDLTGLSRALHRSLPTVGVQTAFLSRYTDASSAELETFVCLLDGGPCQVPQTRFKAHQLFPANAYPQARRHTSLVLPLAFEGQSLGVAVFEYSMGGLGYTMLRDQIGVALRSLGLHQEVVHQTKLHERSVQERRATTMRMASLSVLAGGVAHDLNNALGPLVALPDIIFRELDRLGIGPDNDGGRLRKDVEAIRAAAHRATQTIRDLMTLGRHGRTEKTPFDLNRAVASCLAAEPLLFAEQEKPQVDVTLELHQEPLVVRASRIHLERAVSNLIRNAVESINLTGRVSVTTSHVQLAEPLAGYETVPPGDYAIVAVSDTGHGISPENLGRVFEPFFTNKLLGETSGSGLGLAIVHGVVKEHEGFIDVTSIMGEGTTFRLYIPRAAEQSAPVA
jgi:DNA-binding LacI/PurR family transcriptional regulator/signal transduction histidine kinase